MRTVLKCARTFIAALGAFLWAGGCINLPPALERELACPETHTTDNFGSAAACAPPSAR